MRHISLLNGEYYHIFSRGVDKRPIFIDEQDRLRFIRGLRIINNSKRPTNREFRKNSSIVDPYVEIAAYCLMTNHFHLLVRQRKEGGISSFLQRFLNGYARYFNLRHERTGKLFDGSYKAVHIDSNEQLIATQRYIHLNPVEIVEPGWKETGCKNFALAWKFIKTYPWSSLRYYLKKAKSSFLIPGLLNNTDAAYHNNFIASAITDSQSQLST